MYRNAIWKKGRIMTVEELKEKGAIFIPNIEDGFLYYSHYLMEGSSEEITHKLEELIEENGYEHSYVDFYYGRLREEEQKRVEEVLSKEEIEFLKDITTANFIYFPLTRPLFMLTLKLSLLEILFSTYYFCKTPCTVWGNYNHVFPVFYERIEKE